MASLAEPCSKSEKTQESCKALNSKLAYIFQDGHDTDWDGVNSAVCAAFVSTK